MTRITIIIPCYNEAESIPELIRKLSLIKDDFNFLIVNNGSTDNTLDVIKKLNIPTNISFIKKDINTGYGAGIKYGIKFVRTEYTGWMHGDLQQNPSVLLNAKEMIFSKTNQEASQNLAFKGYRTGRALFENFFTAGVAILSSLLFFDLYWDIAGQPNIFKTSSLKFLDNSPDDHNFEFYVYIQFLRNHGTCKRFEAPFLKRKFGVSSWDKGFLSKVKHAKSVFRYILKLRFKN